MVRAGNVGWCTVDNLQMPPTLQHFDKQLVVGCVKLATAHNRGITKWITCLNGNSPSSLFIELQPFTEIVAHGEGTKVK